ncbi:MAG: ATP-binding protein [Parasporobacterium sp.]|nr:ATP-binding protein [Parasporobacterium sp.]
MDIINLPPIAPTLIESTRAIGYSLEAAIADIIDNSIAAKATQVSISFFPLHGAYISILDNGVGMNAEELTTAMQYGSQNPLEERNVTDLGRYGLGLKTASLSQCSKLTVASKKNGKLEIRRWDIDFVKITGQWSLISLTEEDEINEIPNIHELDQMDSGTLVVWQNLDRMQAGSIDFSKSMGKQIDIVRDHLSLVFHRYLAGEPGVEKLSISINGVDLEPLDPFLLKKSDQTMQEETFIIHGSIIKVQPFILPHISKMTASEIKMAGGKDGLRKLQGFYVYRNKRLLVWGTWFRMMRKGELSKLARIRVDIPNTLDDLWTLDIKKSSAMPPEEVRANLANIIDKIGQKSKIKFTRRGKLETDDSQVHLWNRMKAREGGFYYEINRNHPMVSILESELGNEKKSLDALLTQIERNLPLNQLYIDLNNDEHISNEKSQDEIEIGQALKAMLPEGLSKIEKLEFLDKLSSISPYSKHIKTIEAIKKGIKEDE